MKTIKFLALLWCGTLLGQTHSESIADVVVAAEKTAIGGLLGTELAKRKKQGDLIKDLEDAEEDYNAKRNVLGNFKANTPVVAAVQSKFFFLNQKISNVSATIALLKIASFGFGHGLNRYQNQLDTELGYLQKLESENLLIGAGIAVGGGTGHVFTAYLKLLIRLLEISNNVLHIEKEIEAKNKIVTTLKKLTFN
jgi:hypothetical protein